MRLSSVVSAEHDRARTAPACSDVVIQRSRVLLALRAAACRSQLRIAMFAKLYEVWWSNGTGLRPGPKFRLLSDAERYIADHAADASFAVKSPDGRWEVIVARAAQP